MGLCGQCFPAVWTATDPLPGALHPAGLEGFVEPLAHRPLGGLPGLGNLLRCLFDGVAEHRNDAVEVETLLDRLNVAASRSSLDPLLPVVVCLLSLLGVAVAVAVRFMRSA